MSLKVSMAALAFSAASTLFAQTPPTKVGVINIQQAMLATRDGQKAAQELQVKFEPRRKDIERKNQEIAQLQDQFRKAQNTASEEQKTKLTRDIDQKQKALQRDGEDAEAEFNQERERTLGDLGGRLMQVIDKYARDHAYTLILDISSQQSPVLYMANGIEVTADIVKAYDAAAPAAAPAATKPAGTPSAAPPAATKPTVTPKPTTPAKP